MARYDYKSAKKYIQMHSDLIREALLGMEEDWGCTSETVYEDERFAVDLDDEGLQIAGISGSTWATPTLEIHFKDGRVETKPCYLGDKPSGQAHEWFYLGCISQEIQDKRSGKYLESKQQLITKQGE